MKKIVSIVAGITGIMLVIAGAIMKTKKAVSVSIIGGVDGPTSVFVAGKLGSDISLGLMITGVILIAVVTIMGLRKQKK